MARKSELPAFRKKRNVLFGEKTSKDALRETGRQYLEAKRYYDALEFFQRAGADSDTRKVAEIAIEAGDTPLYMRVKKVLKEQGSEQEWSRLAVNAERAGLYSAAYLAHMKAGHDEEAARLRQSIPGMAPQQAAEGEGEAGQ